MTFSEVLSQTVATLQQHSQAPCRVLKCQFAVDGAFLGTSRTAKMASGMALQIIVSQGRDLGKLLLTTLDQEVQPQL